MATQIPQSLLQSISQVISNISKTVSQIPSAIASIPKPATPASLTTQKTTTPTVQQTTTQPTTQKTTTSVSSSAILPSSIMVKTIPGYTPSQSFPGVVYSSPSPTQTQQTYTVQPGDTLSGIAAKTGVPLSTLKALNPQLERGMNYNLIYPGDVVRLTSTAPTTTSTTSKPTTTTPTTPTTPITPTTPTTPTTPITQLELTTPTTPITPTDIETKINTLLDKYLQPLDYGKIADQVKTIAETINKPFIDVFESAKQSIIQQFEQAKKDLQEQHAKEKEQLLGSWTTRGFTPTEPVVQRALSDLGAKQQKELDELDAKQAQSLSDLAYQATLRQPSEIASIFSSLMTTEKTGLASALGFLSDLYKEKAATEREKIQATKPQIKEIDTGREIVVYLFYPATGEWQELLRIPKTTEEKRYALEPVKDPITGEIIGYFNPATGETHYYPGRKTETGIGIESLPPQLRTPTPSPTTPQAQQEGIIRRIWHKIW